MFPRVIWTLCGIKALLEHISLQSLWRKFTFYEENSLHPSRALNMNIPVITEDAGNHAVPYLHGTTSGGKMVIQSYGRVHYQFLLRLVTWEQNHKKSRSIILFNQQIHFWVWFRVENHKKNSVVYSVFTEIIMYSSINIALLLVLLFVVSNEIYICMKWKMERM